MRKVLSATTMIAQRDKADFVDTAVRARQVRVAFK
jgi:hypothetical protein